MKIIFLIVALILIFIVIYRNSNGRIFYKMLGDTIEPIYDKIAPYSYKRIRLGRIYGDYISWWRSG